MSATRRRLLAIVYGAASHGAFLAAVSLMALGLSTGMRSGIGPFHGATAVCANAALLLQFPLVHSALLTRRGRRVIARLAPQSLGASLASTTYALCASVQIGLTFLLWSPSRVVLFEPRGVALAAHLALFALAWLFLGKSLYDAGLGLQTGWIGWSSVWKGAKPSYPDLPVSGLFARCRQPIYLGFALVLWTAPTWTLDRLAIGVVWGVYCVVGPLHKERRFASTYGERFTSYRDRVPYIIPRVFS